MAQKQVGLFMELRRFRGLTNSARSAIICKLSTRRFPQEAADDRNLKKVEKTFEKPLDKRKGVWYNVEALPHRGKSGEKNFLKSFEKPLDKRMRM
jgi:hypothetical protein